MAHPWAYVQGLDRRCPRGFAMLSTSRRETLLRSNALPKRTARWTALDAHFRFIARDRHEIIQRIHEGLHPADELLFWIVCLSWSSSLPA